MAARCASQTAGRGPVWAVATGPARATLCSSQTAPARAPQWWRRCFGACSDAMEGTRAWAATRRAGAVAGSGFGVMGGAAQRLWMHRARNDAGHMAESGFGIVGEGGPQSADAFTTDNWRWHSGRERQTDGEWKGMFSCSVCGRVSYGRRERHSSMRIHWTSITGLQRAPV